MPIKLYEDGTIIRYAPSPGGRPRGGSVNGSRHKTFEINGKHKRLIRSSAQRQALCVKYKLLFCTLTFPKNIDQKLANKCFSNFVDNLTTNYNLNSYVAVKENTKIGRPHFHCLFDLPYQDYKKLNLAWCRSFRSYMPYSPNAFTTGRRPIISNIKDVARYITKYITKTERAQSEIKPETRQYFISRNVSSRPQDISEWQLEYLISKFGYERYDGDFFTWFRLYDFYDPPEKYKPIADSPRKKKPKMPRIIPVIGPELPFKTSTFIDQKVALHYEM